MAKEKISPGMQQYLDIKENYPDAFLLFTNYFMMMPLRLPRFWKLA